MNDVYQDLLSQALELHKAGQFDKAEELYNRLLNRTPFQEDLTFLLGDLYLRKDFNGLAVNLLSNLLQNNPKHDGAWCNLGAAFRKEGHVDMARAAWTRALEIKGDSAEVCSNMAGLYADRAMPAKALEWIDRTLAVDPESVEGHWLKALALLSLKRWDEGWKEYDWRFKLDSWDSREQIKAPIWDGSHVGSLYIHGEQGVGDEVMFASCLPFVKARHVTVEVNPKVAPIIQKSFPDFDVVTEVFPGEYDAKIAIGSLPRMFGFNREPYLKPDPWRVKFYREELEKLGPGPYVALTWIGGTKATRVEDRSVQVKDLKPLMDAFTCVSAQYSDTNPLVDPEREAAGLPKINDECLGTDLHEQAALFCAVDAVVTVQQTAVHVAGAVGAKCHALIGTHPHWRYGVEGEDLPFYSTVKLHRKKTDWNEVIERILNELRADFSRVREQNAKLHSVGNYGISGAKWAAPVQAIIDQLQPDSVLDYGAGCCTLDKALRAQSGPAMRSYVWRNYDPCVDGMDATPEPADLVVCTDVLEHIEPENLDAVLDDLQRVVVKVGFFVIAARPAKKILPDGRNAHLIQEGPRWWLPKLCQRFEIAHLNCMPGEFLVVVRHA
jgi:tetratricopeptide (TPR) repeat protein